MRKNHLFQTLVLVICLALTAGGLAAQEDDAVPIIVLNGGDLWMWDGPGAPMEQLTAWGYNQQPVLSPSGGRVAYMAWSQITVDALQREGGIAGGEVPGDIKVLDITTGEETLIAGQPPDASFFTEGVPDKAIIRSKPAWSPDGSMLAWTEYDYPGDGINRAMAYRFADGQTQVWVPALPPQVGVPVPMELLWGESGVLLLNFTARPDDPSIFETNFLLYDGETPDELLSSVNVPESEARFMTDYVLVDYEGQEYIGIGYNNDEWDLFNPMTGTAMPAPNPPEMYSPISPDASLSLSLVPGQGDDGSEYYELLDSDGNSVGVMIDLGYDAAGHVALSPDGQAAAYIPYNHSTDSYDEALYLISAQGRRGDATQVKPHGLSFLWGPVAWRIRS